MRDFDPLTDSWDDLEDGELIRFPSGLTHRYSRQAREQAWWQRQVSAIPPERQEEIDAQYESCGVVNPADTLPGKSRKVGPGPNCYSHTHH